MCCLEGVEMKVLKKIKARKQAQRERSRKKQVQEMTFSIECGPAEPDPVRFKPGQSVLEVATGHRLLLAHSCGGTGICGTCRVWVESDPSILPERNEIERETAEARGLSPRERLACQLIAFDGLHVRLPNSDDPGNEK